MSLEDGTGAPGQIPHPHRHHRSRPTDQRADRDSRDLLPVVAEARVGLPQFAEVIALSVWDKIVATGSETRALPTVAPGDPAQIQYTSGTTGLPKGAQLTHRGLVNVGRCEALANGAGPGDVWVNPICKVIL
ncbi:MAG: fatty-acyl-CoA synthase [Pseudonocardia sp.]|nr:fatty-acyl-CoA synthase [Pseudonocardia sp.]